MSEMWALATLAKHMKLKAERLPCFCRSTSTSNSELECRPLPIVMVNHMLPVYMQWFLLVLFYSCDHSLQKWDSVGCQVKQTRSEKWDVIYSPGPYSEPESSKSNNNC